MPSHHHHLTSCLPPHHCHPGGHLIGVQVPGWLAGCQLQLRPSFLAAEMQAKIGRKEERDYRKPVNMNCHLLYCKLTERSTPDILHIKLKTSGGVCLTE